MLNSVPLTKTNLSPQYDRVSWGVVELQVTDLDRAIEFWSSALGLIERDQSASGIALGTRDRTLIVLHSGADTPVAAPYTGMYHVAIGVRSQAEFSRMLARLIQLNVQVGPTDHLMAKSLYLQDPDGLEIEITYETPERFGHFGDMSKGLTLYSVNGEAHSGRGPLDVRAELSHAAGADPMAPLADDSYLAHLHFKVPALEPALEWYETLGFERHLTLDAWGFADMGAGAPNTHRLAMNIWAGPNNPPMPQGMAGLVHYELITHSEIVASPHLRQDGDALRGTDPAGVAVTLRSAK
ncbi:putative ring-cleavage extradiol dioxygenase [Hoeflea phototrophica DFL-43]|uniref:Putative ring-cleavage extradiol dioxygenase n=1 Tax=Hoeflea phototrophica (strain DSM 17068 / NCIMB 14078 / DFL-43) TaxID=411684 RepID=A9DE58_HOEPD|nr:VOC family protein [Hoeflea phototrophica]EDQ31969.1 putative ring-cleavage extradiol dioxygenase [Hoeflea phototrophica DFL-43]